MSSFLLQVLERTEASGVLVDARTHHPLPLAMQRLHLAGRVTPAGAFLQIIHTFECEGDAAKPLEAIYVSMLPRDAALRRFKIKGDDFEQESELKPRPEARKEYEEGVQAGHLSSLCEVNPDGLVSLTVGQIRPGEKIQVILEVVAGVDMRDRDFRFRFPLTLSPSYHPQVSGSTTPEGVKIELPESIFGDLVLPEFKTEAKGLHGISFTVRCEPGGDLESISSPSHRVTTRLLEDGSAEVTLAGLEDKPNRDLILDVRSREATPTVFVDKARVTKKKEENAPKLPKDAPGWMVALPSNAVTPMKDQKRRLCFVIDRSGSMGGGRMEKAKQAVTAALSGLDAKDEFGLVTFDTEMEVFHEQMVAATTKHRQVAQRFLDQTYARGGTELAQGLATAIKVLDGEGDILLITDGDVFNTGPIIESMASCKAKVHVLGVGDACQDRFLSSLARRSGGVQRMVTASEDVASAAMELFNAVGCPVRRAVKALIKFKGSKKTQEHKIGDIWSGRPILIVDNGEGTSIPSIVELSWKGGKQEIKVSSPDARRVIPTGLVALLVAGRQVQDLESALDMARGSDPVKASLEGELKKVSVAYGLASRVMSLVAVVKRVGDQKDKEMDQQVVPVGAPEEMVDVGGMLRSAGPQIRRLAVSSRGRMQRRQRNVSHFSGSVPTLGGERLYSPEISMDSLMLPDSIPCGAAAPSGAAECGCEVTEFDVVLLSHGPKKINVMKALRVLTGIGLKESKDMVENIPSTIKEAVSKEEAEEVKEALEKVGATVTVRVFDDDPDSPWVNFSPGVQPSADTRLPRLGDSPTSTEVLGLLGQLLDDGGLPGSDPNDRFVATAALALAVLSLEVNGVLRIYQAHLRKMADFLDKYTGKDAKLVTKLVAKLKVATGDVPGDWMALYDRVALGTVDSTVAWSEISSAL